MGGGQDIWRSKDGKTWEIVTLSAAWEGRGGHQVVISGPQVFVVGGRTGDTAVAASTRYLNDVWWANVTDFSVWSYEPTPRQWQGRAEHTVVVEAANPNTFFVERMFVIGGENERGPLSDVWVWIVGPGSPWAEDYTADEYYEQGSGTNYVFEPGSPAQYYFDDHTRVEQIIKHYLPESATEDPAGTVVSYLSDTQVTVQPCRRLPRWPGCLAHCDRRWILMTHSCLRRRSKSSTR